MKILFALLIVLMMVAPVYAGEKKQKTYLKYPADNRILRPYSRWNPLLHIGKDGKIKSKSYFKYPTSVFPGGSFFNPLLTVPRKEKGKKNGK